MATSCTHQPVGAPPAPAGFDFAEPDGLAAALDLLATHGPKAALVAGGTDLLRLIRLGLARPELVVSLARIPELAGIHETAAGLTIGASVTMAELADSAAVRALAPSLAEAAGQVGSPQVRNRATMAGNLINASPCADTAPPAVVHEAVLLLESSAGERRVPAAEFMTGPGQSVRRPDEILVAIEIPRPGAHSGSAYETLTRRKALEITIASATARISLAGPAGAIQTARVCLGSVAPTPLLSKGAEQILTGQAPSAELIAQAAEAAAKDASPIDDLRAGADYRRQMVAVLARRALERAWQLARGGAGA